MKLLKQYGLVLFAALFAFAYANAQNEPQSGSIKVGSVAGKVTLLNPNTGETTDAEANAVFTAPTTVITDSDATTTLVFSNGSIVEVKPGSRIDVTFFTQAPFDPELGSFETLLGDPSISQVSIRVVSGEIAAKIATLQSGSSFTIETPSGVIDGDEAIVVVNYNPQTAETRVANISGDVSYENAAGQTTTVTAGSALQVPGQVDPTTGAVVAGEPVSGPLLASDTDAAQGVQQPVVTPVAPTAPTTAQQDAATTPNTDLTELIDPTSTAPAQ